MLIFSLKRCVLFVFISAFATLANAQQDHFVYLQTENAKPFYVKLDNKVVSSSVTGYLIIPKLVDGDYNIAIGFPKNEFPEENFQITVNKKDEGFLLKNFDDKGWGLFNMQSYAISMGVNKSTVTEEPSKNLQTDPFSKMLAKVVKDSSILQKNDTAQEISSLPKVYSTPVVTKTATNVDTTAVTKQATITVAQASLLSPATKISSKKNDDGVEMMYVDYNIAKNDTVRIFMPEVKEIIKSDSVVNTNTVEKPKESDLKQATIDSSLIKAEQQKTNSKVDTTVTNSTALSDQTKAPEIKDTIVIKKVEETNQPAAIPLKDSVVKQENNLADTTKDKMVMLPKAVKTSTTNSDCKAFAADEDFLKLRKKMASENSNDEMIKIAKKAFHSKCFSTEQIKNLSFLFLTDEGKYVFFDAAYPFVSDSDQYHTLQSQITNSYYINRFKAMVNK